MEFARSDQLGDTTSVVPSDAVVVVASSDDDMTALRGLVLRLLKISKPDPGAIWDEIANYKERADEWSRLGLGTKDEEWGKALFDLAERAIGNPLPGAHEAALALATVLEMRRAEVQKSQNGMTALVVGKDMVAPVFFSAARPVGDEAGYGELHFQQTTVALVLKPGSRIVQTVLGTAFQFAKFAAGTCAVLRSPRASAEDIVQRLRAQRKDHSYPLQSLDDSSRAADALSNKSGVVIFLHGIFSTDLGTFDGFIGRWLHPHPACLPAMARYGEHQLFDKTLPPDALVAIKDSVALFGWPHDTLCGINKNAQDLVELIDRHFGGLSCPIAFVCHSRGGLLARKTAEKLFRKNPKWLQRICCAITFGTPHDGADFAEHPGTMLGTYLLLAQGTHSAFGLFDALAYVAARGTVEGVLDLRPSSASGSFIQQLIDQESEGQTDGPRRLCVAAVGGKYSDPASGAPLMQRLTRAYASIYSSATENDLVVTYASAMKADTTQGSLGATSCDHFTYFTHEQSERPHVDSAINRLWTCFNLATVVDPKIVKRSDDAGTIEQRATEVDIGGVVVPRRS